MKSLRLFLTVLGVCEAGRLFQSEEEVERLERRQALDYPANFFEQPVNHFPDNPRYGLHTGKTFQQRYFFDSSFYKPGGPVFLYIGGETSGPSRFENLETGIIRILMEATGGLGVILENRYYGKSYPYNLSTTDNLRFLTTEQTIADNANFAQHATFPGVPGGTDGTINGPNTPWILYGGSLAGAQTAFSLKEYGGDGGVLWGGIASSGVTQAKLAYPEWYNPILKYGPPDCMASISAIVKNIDYIFSSGDANLIRKMKGVFDMEDLADQDFAQAIAFPIGGPFYYPTCTWQELNWDPDVSCNDFSYFCSNVTNLDAPETITSVDNALAFATNGEPWTNLGNYANYIKEFVNPICSGFPLSHTPFAGDYCFGTQNRTYWADIRNSAKRSYLYQTCTEFGLYQVAPKSGPSLISNVLQTDYTQGWCNWAFPPGNISRIPSTPDLERVNKYGGYAVIQDRLARIDGDIDVWNDADFHSNDAPTRYSRNPTEAYLHPQLLIAGGGHHWDSSSLGSVANIALEPIFIQYAHRWEINIVQKWLEDWKAKK